MALLFTETELNFSAKPIVLLQDINVGTVLSETL